MPRSCEHEITGTNGCNRISWVFLPNVLLGRGIFSENHELIDFVLSPEPASFFKDKKSASGTRKFARFHENKRRGPTTYFRELVVQPLPPTGRSSYSYFAHPEGVFRCWTFFADSFSLLSLESADCFSMLTQEFVDSKCFPLPLHLRPISLDRKQVENDEY